MSNVHGYFRKLKLQQLIKKNILKTEINEKLNETINNNNNIT